MFTHVCRGALGKLEEGIGSLGAGVQVVVCCLMWVLGLELRSPARAASAPNH